MANGDEVGQRWFKGNGGPIFKKMKVKVRLVLVRSHIGERKDSVFQNIFDFVRLAWKSLERRRSEQSVDRLVVTEWRVKATPSSIRFTTSASPERTVRGRRERGICVRLVNGKPCSITKSYDILEAHFPLLFPIPILRNYVPRMIYLVILGFALF